MQQNSGHIIIGGGISGLIFQYYHPEFTIITPDVGGLFGKSHLIWLHDTPETRQLLKDLKYDNIDKRTKKSWIGYYWKGWIHETRTLEIELLTIQKKMSKWNEPIDKTFIPPSFDMSTTKQSGANYLNSLDVDLLDVVNRISKNSNIIEGRVTNIKSNSIEIEHKNQELETIEYLKLVSTIPAPIFWAIYKDDKKILGFDFKSIPITTVITPTEPDMWNDKFEMIYCDDSVPFSRISKPYDKYALEFTGELNKEQFRNLFPNIQIESIVPVKFGRIFENKNHVSPSENITFLGRFAQWKFGITSEHVIKQTLEYAS